MMISLIFQMRKLRPRLSSLPKITQKRFKLRSSH